MDLMAHRIGKNTASSSTLKSSNIFLFRLHRSVGNNLSQAALRGSLSWPVHSDFLELLNTHDTRGLENVTRAYMDIVASGSVHRYCV